MLDPDLIEHLDRRFAEAADQNDRRFSRIDARFESIDARFESIDARFESIDTRFESLETQVRRAGVLIEDLDAKIRLVAEGVAVNTQMLREFKIEVAHQFEEVKAVNRLSYAELERRIAALER